MAVKLFWKSKPNRNTHQFMAKGFKFRLWLYFSLKKVQFAVVSLKSKRQHYDQKNSHLAFCLLQFAPHILPGNRRKNCDKKR